MRVLILIVLAALLVNFRESIASEITENDQYVYIKRGWDEITEETQRGLILYFREKFIHDLEEINAKINWDKAAEDLLLGDQPKYHWTSLQIQTRTDSFASDHKIQLSDLVPTGFVIGIGINGSGEVVLGLGASALVTLIVVPLEVECYNKTTQESHTQYEASWAIGGIGQSNLGAGMGAGIGLHGAVGIIWGDLPDASALRGWALGVSGNLSDNLGIGFMSAIVFDSATKHDNLVALATYDLGVQAGGLVSASLFYFMQVNEIINYFSGGKFNSDQGFQIINPQDLGVHTP